MRRFTFYNLRLASGRELRGSAVVLLLSLLLTMHVANGADSRSGVKAERKPASTNATATAVTLRGRVVCLPEEMHRRHGTELPTSHEHIWAFSAASSELYTILPGRYSEAIFQDERVRAKELQLRARILPKSQVIEILTIHSVRNNVVQDLYYYCDVCAIKSVSPAICACCQGPVELTEKPLSQRDE